jgi:hypothetical protein
VSNDQNRIACFKNKKEKDTHPDYRLVGDFEGTRIKGAFWLKKDKNGNTYMSGKLERDEGQQQARGGGGGQEAAHEPTSRAGPKEDFDLDDSIPFARNDGLR